MAEPTKYLVHVQCQPMPLGNEGQMAAELAQNFPVARCWSSGGWLTIELVSGNRLANGVLKDLANHIQVCLAGRGAELKSGVVHRRAPGPVEASARSVVTALERLSVDWPPFTGLLGRLAARIAGPARWIPEMYFHWGITWDLALAGRLQRTTNLQ